MQITEWNGQPITEPGWYSGIPLERYHSAGICDGPAVSSSNLRQCWLRSPAHMHAQWCENPDAEPIKVTRFMQLGTSAHYMLLGESYKLALVCQPTIYRDKVTAIEKPWNNNATYCRDWTRRQTEAGKTV